MGRSSLMIAAFLFAGTAGMLQAESNGNVTSNPGSSKPQGQQQAPGSSLTDGQDGIDPTDTHEGGKPASKGSVRSHGLNNASDGEGVPLGSMGGNPKRTSHNNASDNEGVPLGSMGGNPKRTSHNNASDDEGVPLGSMGGNPKRSSHNLTHGQTHSADDEGVPLGSLGGNPKRSSHNSTHGQITHPGSSKWTGGVRNGKAGNGLTKNGLQKANTLNSLSKNTIGGAGGTNQLPAAAK